MSYQFVIDARVKDDVREAVSYYNQRVNGLGEKFYEAVKEGYKVLQRNPHFQTRYKHIHCLPLKKFPYMIHFSIDETTKTVTVHAVLSCYLNPDENWL